MKTTEQLREYLDDLAEDRSLCLLDSYLPSETFGLRAELDEIRMLQDMSDNELVEYIKSHKDDSSYSIDMKHLWKWLNN